MINVDLIKKTVVNFYFNGAAIATTFEFSSYYLASLTSLKSLVFPFLHVVETPPTVNYYLLTNAVKCLYNLAYLLYPACASFCSQCFLSD